MTPSIKETVSVYIIPVLIGAGLMWMIQQSRIADIEEAFKMRYQQEQFMHIEEDLNRRLNEMERQIQNLHHQFDIERTANERDMDLYHKAARDMANKLQAYENQ